MYVCVVVDKLNHCTAFKPRRSPRVINIHMQIYKSGNAAASWPTETRWVFLEKRSWGFRKLSGANEDAQGPRGSGAPPAGGSGHVQEKQNKTKQNLSNTRSRKWGPEPGAQASSVCSQEKEPNVDLKAESLTCDETNCCHVWMLRWNESTLIEKKFLRS